MRISRIATFIQSLSGLSSNSRARIAVRALHSRPPPPPPQQLLLSSSRRITVVQSMSALGFFSSLFSSSGPSNADKMSYPVEKSDDEWRAILNPKQFRILREKGTEAPGTGEYNEHSPETGVYNCVGCNAPLYRANHKFKSHCGWPSFFDALPGAVTRHEDKTLGMQRIEIVCSNCGGHLGHVFKGEGYSTPTDERHCVNSVSLKFANEEISKDEATPEVEGKI